MFHGKRKWIISGLGLLLVAALLAFFLTRPSAKPILRQKGQVAVKPQPKLVDESPLQTATSLAAMASTAEEQHIAEQAVRVADHAVDLAFASALQQAQDNPPQPTPAVKEISDRVHRLESRLLEMQQQVAQLTKLVSTPGNHDDAQRQLQLTQARVSLLQDVLADAKEDLQRAGGDPQAEIQQELEQHEAADHTKPASTGAKPAALNIESSLFAQFRQWQRLGENLGRLLQAQQQANAAVQRLTAKHQALEKGLPEALGSIGDESEEAEPADEAEQVGAVAKMHILSDNSKLLSMYDKRIQAQQQLAELYGQWMGVVDLQRRSATHAMLRSLLWILLALIGIVLAEGLIERFYLSLGPDRRRLGTMRMVLRFVSQMLGALVILLVLFGLPTQLSTVLALAGAGLTVALKDFIVAFFGWFVLMGRHGIRRGDWVEINGIGGEVVEVGLLHTLLLETGNWNDAGHPTGREVSFVNSFAVEGHYFNFTTAGQWLWDELDILIPAGEDPYELTKAVMQLVTEHTREDAAKAEQEWHRVVGQSTVQDFSASPAVDVRPTNLGVNLVVRYVVNAHNRYPVRTRLYQAIVELLHAKRSEVSK